MRDNPMWDDSIILKYQVPLNKHYWKNIQYFERTLSERSLLAVIHVDIPVSRLIWMAATWLSNGRARINTASLISRRTGLSTVQGEAWCCTVVDNREACQHISSGSFHFERLPVFPQIMQVSMPYAETEHPLRCIIKMTNATYLTTYARQKAKDASLVST